MSDYQSDQRTSSLLSSILAALGGGTSDGSAFTPGATAFTTVGGEVDDVATSTLTEGTAGAVRSTTFRALHVNLRDNSGNEVAPGGGTTDGATFTPASSTYSPVGGEMDDVSPAQLTEGKGGAARSTAFRAIHVNLRDNSGNEVSVGGGTQYTEDAPAAADPVGTILNLVRNDARTGGITSTDGDNISARGTNSGELYVKHVDSLPATQSGTWNIGTVTTVTNVVHVDDNAGSLTVDQATAANLNATVVQATAANLNATVAQSGTWNIGTVTTLTGITNVVHVDDNSGSLTVDNATASSLKNEPAGNVAHDGVDSGNPIKMGSRAKTTLTGVTLVSADDRSDLFCDLDGVLLARKIPLGNIIAERVTDTGGSSTAFSTFGATANLRNYVTQVTICNAHASTYGTVDFRDGTAGSVIYTFPAPPAGGSVMHFDPPLRQPTVNTALAYDVSAAITTITISINGYQSKA